MTQTVKFEKVVGDGKALGYIDGKAVFAAGPLPGEEARIRIVKDKPRYMEAVVEEIVTKSDHRSQPAEAHYLACSPWQGVDYHYQLELKRHLVTEVFGRPELELSLVDFVAAKQQIGYRNKLEFTISNNLDTPMLAFHERGSYESLIPLPDGCKLGSEAMNQAAKELLLRITDLKLPGYMEALTVRQSSSTGEIIGIISLHQVPKRDWQALSVPGLAGIVVSRMRHRSEHEIIWHTGAAQLEQTVLGMQLAYPFDAFFQTNVAMFEIALAQILAAIPTSGRVIDLYGGVGTIGLAVARLGPEVLGLELNAAASEWATSNADRVGVMNYSSQQVQAERMPAGALKGAETVILDPPRAGLHPRVINELLVAAPQRIIYLSCNPVTQVRDLILLKDNYSCSGVTGFDFYPGTLHTESLAILERVV